MNFNLDASKSQPGATPNTNTTTVGGQISFGALGAGDANKANPTAFTMLKTPVQNKTTGFNTGMSTPTQTTSFGFGVTPQTTTNLTFGIGSSAQANAPANINLATNTVAIPGFNLTSSAAGTMSVGSGLTFGTPTATTATTGGFLTGTVITPTATATTTGVNLKLNPATTSSIVPFMSKPTSTQGSTGFTLGTGTTTIAPIATTSTDSSCVTATTQATLSTATTVTSSAGGNQQGSINFAQLEESINTWTMELEEQEKAFMNQATQVNAWDKILIANGDKIVLLNEEVERVKLEQQQLENELDYVVSQQKELEDCLIPLEKELGSLSISDPEREYTYSLAEDLDRQLKKMSEDLKEIIEHLNEANRAQDSSDPIVQIGKILNAHMNSLQWLDQHTTLLSKKIMQIDEMHQNFRQENERNINLAYN